MYTCDVCGKAVFNIVYHTPGYTHKFCGAECSLAYYTKLKEKENGK